MEALMMLVPEAYKNQPALDDKPEITAFYDYYSGLQEAWDGPALLVCTCRCVYVFIDIDIHTHIYGYIYPYKYVCEFVCVVCVSLYMCT